MDKNQFILKIWTSVWRVPKFWCIYFSNMERHYFVNISKIQLLVDVFMTDFYEASWLSASWMSVMNKKNSINFISSESHQSKTYLYTHSREYIDECKWNWISLPATGFFYIYKQNKECHSVLEIYLHPILPRCVNSEMEIFVESE